MTLSHIASQRLSNGPQDADPTSTRPAPGQDLPCPPALDGLIATLAADIKTVRSAAGLGSKSLKTRELVASIQAVIEQRYIPGEGRWRILPFAPKSMAWIHDVPSGASKDMFRKITDILDREG